LLPMLSVTKKAVTIRREDSYNCLNIVYRSILKINLAIESIDSTSPEIKKQFIDGYVNKIKIAGNSIKNHRRNIFCW